MSDLLILPCHHQESSLRENEGHMCSIVVHTYNSLNELRQLVGYPVSISPQTECFFYETLNPQLLSSHFILPSLSSHVTSHLQHPSAGIKYVRHQHLNVGQTSVTIGSKSVCQHCLIYKSGKGVCFPYDIQASFIIKKINEKIK